MRIRLLTNTILNGYSLQMCQDYWRPFHPSRYQTITLEWHIKQICQHYDVTFEELFSKLLLVKAYDTSIRCVTCGQMYEVFNPCDLPNPNHFVNWQCDSCRTFRDKGKMSLQDFLNAFDDCPF